MSLLKIITLLFVLFVLFTGCSQKIEHIETISKANFQKVEMQNLQGFENDNLTKALKVFIKDCQASQKNPNLKEVCLKAQEDDILRDAKEFFLQHFTAYQIVSDEEGKEGLITGYYEPLLQGSYTQTNRYKYPVYSVPKDLLTIQLSKAYPSLSNYRLRGKLKGNTVVPYETREEIEALDYKTAQNLKPICFVDNKIDLFFLQIQGSGKVELPDGEYINIGYGGQNGHPYYAIGRKLIEIGVIEKKDISLQTIREWLVQNPEKADGILNLNQSYVFFRQSEKTATGSLGTELTANRNLAVDRKNIPLGFPVFINTTNPITEEPINRLMIAADTGGAIKGKIRADFFFGNGSKARELAGKMKQEGELFVFLPNNKIEKKD
ncbi:MltA domain-containing protein [Arcobacteraceae bacterium]|nr:MltA domain-containing protein [Arcobacteraceae bacterium]